MKRIHRLLACVLAIVCTVLAHGALAHKPSDAYLTLHRDGAVLQGQWDIALRDLDAAIGLDVNGDGEITWGEVVARAPAIDGYALSRLAIRSGGAACPLAVRAHLADRHTDGGYVVLALHGRCAIEAPLVQIRYGLLFDVDPQHHGLAQYVERGHTQSLVFTSTAPLQDAGAATGSVFGELATYVREGVVHIWQGFDHILFLLSLLIPAVLVRDQASWRAEPSFRRALVEVAKVVTAFTVAHSITLSLAALHVVALPSRWVESAIALSVVLAAANNIRPVLAHGRWIAAFAFGLVHGFGFAGALQDLGLPRGALALSLFGFNAGVELGQLAIVVVFLPVAFALRATWMYRRVALVGGSGAIAAIALVWLAERALDVSLIAALAAP